MESALAGQLVATRRELERAWSADTSTDPDDWRSSRPSVGQCTVTALLVHDRLGGTILRALVCGHSHFWNRLPDGTEVDLARDQFAVWLLTGPVEVRSREHVLGTRREDGTTTERRYERLVARLRSRTLSI